MEVTISTTIYGYIVYAAFHSKDVVAILHLMVALSRHFRCPHPLPRNVSIKRIFLKQLENKLDSRIIVDQITGDDIGPT